MVDATTELDALAFCALGWDDVPVAEGPKSSRFASFRRWLVAPQVGAGDIGLAGENQSGGARQGRARNLAGHQGMVWA